MTESSTFTWHNFDGPNCVCEDISYYGFNSDEQNGKFQKFLDSMWRSDINSVGW